MIIEKITAEDIPFIQNLQPSGWLDIIPSFQFYFNNRNWCNPVKAVINNHLAGIGCSISFKKSTWLAHIIVDPIYRKQGIGLSIVNNLCDQLKSSGVETIFII
ncbi:MAG: GNAT family N-acetyltransferase [Spirochaetes bacterium]|nr:GNAT family N-acetyltransferase [Spirochaetota bacterium]